MVSESLAAPNIEAQAPSQQPCHRPIREFNLIRLLNFKSLTCGDVAHGLDLHLNPVLDNDRTGEREAVSWNPRGDWREDARAMENIHHRLAAHGQSCGVAAPDGEYHRCKNGRGVFSNCVINFDGAKLQSNGACMNCFFTKEAYRCSLRKCLE